MITILIQRRIAPDMASTYEEFAKKTIQAAVTAPGFISGQSLEDINDSNNRYVIVKMRTLKNWQRWEKSEERREALECLRPLLLEPEKITLLTNP